MLLRKTLLTLAVLAVCPWAGRLPAEEPKTISPEQFDKLHKMIKPSPMELQWEALPWAANIYDARKKAAEQGKPILMISTGGEPHGVC